MKLEDLSAQPQLQPATYSDKSREAAHLAVIVDHSVAYNITSEQKNNETALVNIDIVTLHTSIIYSFLDSCDMWYTGDTGELRII